MQNLSCILRYHLLVQVIMAKDQIFLHKGNHPQFFVTECWDDFRELLCHNNLLIQVDPISK